MNRFGLNPKAMSPEVPITFSGPAGTLEGLWRPPRPGAALRGLVVVAHPHPAFGGTMMNKVVFHTARVLNHDLDLAALRFNFRGVGKSAGRYDEGRGEVDDVLAAWAEARRREPGSLPLVAAGFSFGSGMTLAATARPAEAGAPQPAVLVLIGLPVRLFSPPNASPPRSRWPRFTGNSTSTPRRKRWANTWRDGRVPTPSTSSPGRTTSWRDTFPRPRHS